MYSISCKCLSSTATRPINRERCWMGACASATRGGLNVVPPSQSPPLTIQMRRRLQRVHLDCGTRDLMFTINTQIKIPYYCNVKSMSRVTAPDPPRDAAGMGEGRKATKGKMARACAALSSRAAPLPRLALPSPRYVAPAPRRRGGRRLRQMSPPTSRARLVAHGCPDAQLPHSNRAHAP